MTHQFHVVTVLFKTFLVSYGNFHQDKKQDGNKDGEIMHHPDPLSICHIVYSMIVYYNSFFILIDV